MVQFHFYNNNEEKREFIRGLIPTEVTYLVPDLASKQVIQNEWLSSHGVLAEDSVLRAQEFWIKHLRMHEPTLQLVSQPFMVSLLDDWLQKQKDTFEVFPGTASLLAKYIQLLLPLLSSSQHTQNTIEWLKQNPEALTRWGNWFFLAHRAWQYCCELRTVMALWSAGYLSQTGYAIKWPRKLIVDVNVQLKGIEVDLLMSMANTHEIIVLTPKAPSAVLAVYKNLQERLGQLSQFPEVAHHSFAEQKHLHAKRFATELSEIKAAVAWVRTQLDAKVPIHDIAILAADIEHYWPCLSAYLDKEGIPVAKSKVSNVSLYPQVMRWLSRLRLLSKQVQTGDLELVLFQKQATPQISYAEFQKLFSQIYDENDLNRHTDTKSLYTEAMRIKEKWTRDEFVARAFLEWGKESLTPEVERLIAMMLLECPRNLQLRYETWLRYLEDITAKAEVTVGATSESGIELANLEAVYNLSGQKIFVLGMTQNYLVSHSDMSITAGDIAKLMQDLGVYLEGLDVRINDWAANWLLREPPVSEITIAFAETDFAGEPLAPSRLWMEVAAKPGHDETSVELPAPTRWDEVQQNIRNEESQTEIAEAVDLDRGDKVLPHFHPVQELVFSASQLEKYRDCPFKFAAEKIFRLRDEPVVDLDMDRMTRGRVLHEVLRHVTKKPWTGKFEEPYLLDLLDLAYQNEQAGGGLVVVEMWPVRRLEYLEIIKRFILFENDWRKQFPQTSTDWTEHEFETNWQIHPDKSIRVRGQIDRVDTDPNKRGLVLLDYKSGGQYTQAGSWIKNNKLQLLFYALLIEEGCLPEIKGDVIGAFYYLLSKMNRLAGFRTEGSEYLLSENSGGKTIYNSEDKKALLAECRAVVVEVLQNIELGLFAPMPRDRKNCSQCRWRLLCRAPHLN